MSKLAQDTRPLGSPQSWAKTPGTFISAQAHIDGADHAAVTMEQKWGVGRLRLLVSPELRDKFDRQRYLLNQAIWHGDLEAVRRESSRMVAAWHALDKAANQAGAPKLDPTIWEVRMEDGVVAALAWCAEDAHTVTASGRKVVVYTLSEIANMLFYYRQISEAKRIFPGATVEAVRRPSDPLHRFHDTAAGLDEPIDDPISDLGA